METASQKVTLVGSGLVGSLMALYLAKHGYEVEVFERRPDMRTTNIDAGRSINLALSTRGIYALHQVGLEKEVLELAIPMLGRMIHALNGETNLQRYGRDDSEYINSISRGDLNKLLMNRAEETGKVKIHFNKNVTSIDFKKRIVYFIDEVAQERGKAEYNILIGTDGSASVLRDKISKYANAELTEEYLNYSYKELIIPAGANGTFLLNKNALHIWPRGKFMLIALPNLDGSFTATLFLPQSGNNSFEQLKTHKAVDAFFAEHFSDVVPLFSNLAEEFFAHPIGRMITVKCEPWNYKNQVLLMGDAAHAIVPFFGQGMNCGFEDCSVLNEILSAAENDWEKVFNEFFKQRKENTDAIADMAVENFIEMRDKVAQPKFVMEKSIERVLTTKFPQDYISRYQLVTFTRVPYTAAFKAGLISNQILGELGKNLTKAEDVNLELAEKLITTKLSQYLKDFKKESYGFQN